MRNVIQNVSETCILSIFFVAPFVEAGMSRFLQTFFRQLESFPVFEHLRQNASPKNRERAVGLTYVYYRASIQSRFELDSN